MMQQSPTPKHALGENQLGQELCRTLRDDRRCPEACDVGISDLCPT